MNFVCRLNFIYLDTLVYLERRPCTSGIVSFEYIDVGTGGGTGGTCPQDFAINKEVPFLFLESAPFFLRKSALEVWCPSKFEMLPTALFE